MNDCSSDLPEIPLKCFQALEFTANQFRNRMILEIEFTATPAIILLLKNHTGEQIIRISGVDYKIVRPFSLPFNPFYNKRIKLKLEKVIQ